MLRPHKKDGVATFPADQAVVIPLKGVSDISLTVLMPVYNMIQYLKEAIESVLAQDEPNFKFLVLDDGSRDGSLEYIQSLTDPRIRLSASVLNLGLGSTLSRGLDLCDTHYFVRMDADDVIFPSKFSRQLQFLNCNKHIGMVGTQFHYFGSGGSSVLSPTLPLDNDTIVKRLHEKSLSLVHGSLMCRTETIKKAGGYRVKGMGEDWDMFLRVSEISEIANLPDDLYGWRLHDSNAKMGQLMRQQLGISYACDCANMRASGKKERSFEEFEMYEKLRPPIYRLGRFVDVLALAQYRMALIAISCGRPVRGRIRLALAALFSPKRTIRRLQRIISSRKKASE